LPSIAAQVVASSSPAQKVIAAVNGHHGVVAAIEAATQASRPVHATPSLVAPTAAGKAAAAKTLVCLLRRLRRSHRRDKVLTCTQNDPE